MSPTTLKKQTDIVIDLIQKNRISSEEQYIINKLSKISKYLAIRLELPPKLAYSDILTDKEFSMYISELWNPTSFMGYYNPTFSNDNAKIINEYQEIIKKITIDIKNN